MNEFRKRLEESQGEERVQLLALMGEKLFGREALDFKKESGEALFFQAESLILLAKERGTPEVEADLRIRYATTLLSGLCGHRTLFVEKASEQFKLGLALGEFIGSKVIVRKSFSGLSLCAELGGDFEAAYRLLRQSNEWRDHEGDRNVEVRDDFLAMISHEIRTPMNGIVGMSELLSRMKLDSEVRGLVDVIHECGLTLSTILDDFLDSNQFEESNVDLRLESLDVSGLFNRTIRMFNLRRKPGVEFRFEWDDSTYTHIWGDPTRIRQILNNLLTNAFKFTDEGFVCCRVYNEGPGSVVFEIEDSGRGVSAKDRLRLFQKGKGGSYNRIGMGLALCQQLARLMKGNLGYRNREEGGSVFTLKLPTPEVAAQEGHLVSKPIERVSRVLVVEDTELNWKVIQLMLSNLGVQADWASGGSEALAQFEEEPYQLIFMDFQMDEMDGPETTQHIRKIVADKKIPQPYIVALTADLTAANRLKELSMDDFLGKPVRIEVLEGVINRFRSWSTESS